jgi:hypothetical protein
MSRLEECKKISIVSFLASHGFQPVKPPRGGKAVYSSPLHPESNPSFTVFLSSNRWIDYGISIKSSDVIDLVCQMEGCDTKKAMDILVGDEELSEFEPVEVSNGPLITVTKVVDNYIAPELLMYLSARKIPSNLYRKYTKQVFYNFRENPDRSYFGVGFQGDLGGWEIRNSYHKYATSPKSQTTIGEGKTLTLFEGFVNMLSAMAFFGVEQFEGTTICLNGLGILHRILPELNQYEKINCFLDHGTGGNNAMNLIRSVCGLEKVIDGRCLYREDEDFNNLWVRLNT